MQIDMDLENVKLMCQDLCVSCSVLKIPSPQLHGTDLSSK